MKSQVGFAARAGRASHEVKAPSSRADAGMRMIRRGNVFIGLTRLRIGFSLLVMYNFNSLAF